MMRMAGKNMRSKIPVLLFLLYATPLWADWKVEEEKINFLLSEIGHLDGMFIRNGTKHSPEQAVDHLKMKMENAMNAWFAPDKEKWTAEMFISKIASKSSISGKPYKIRFKTGRTVNAGDWLQDRLKNFNSPQ